MKNITDGAHSNIRKSNIELLRILAMIMIIGHHVAVHSGFNFSATPLSINWLWLRFIQMGGKIGVNIFVLITGYFTITAPQIKTQKLLKLWLQILTYSLLCTCVYVVCTSNPIGAKALVQTIFPITYSQWWFASTYFMLCLVAPFINKMLTALKRTEYLHLLVLLFFCWCFTPTFLHSKMQSNDFLWFVYLYAFSGYLRLHIDLHKIKSSVCFLVSAFTIGLTYFASLSTTLLPINIPLFSLYTPRYYDMQSPLIFLISLMLFIGFANIRIGYSPVINLISSASFGVYLLHDSNYIRPLLWQTIFKMAAYQDLSTLVVYSLFVIAVVFFGCTLVELFRIHTIEKLYLKIINRLALAIDQCLEKIYSRQKNSQ